MIWPSVADERAEALREIAPAWAGPPAWKSYGMIVSLVFFFFTTFAVSAFWGFLEMMVGSLFVLPAILCIAIAEWLIQRKRFFGTGIESGLWASAMVLLIMALPRSGRVESILVFALAAAIVGMRMRSPIFGALASILVVAYAGVKWTSVWPAVAISIAIAFAAVVALTRRWQRPSTERLFAFTAVLMPLAGYISALIRHEGNASLAIGAAYAIAGAIFLAIAIPRRDRAILIASWMAIAIAITETRDVVPLANEVKVMLAGALLVAVAAAVSRALRDNATGFVITPSTLTRLDEAIQIIVGTLPAAPAHAAAPQREAGGGGFGGAGASGQY